MQRLLSTWFVTAICGLILLLQSVSSSANSGRMALVIGNSAYRFSPLVNPVNDAMDMAATLKALGFSVNLKTDADQRSMEESIRLFGKQLRSGGTGLFYFAGHGLQVKGVNYLIPIGADINSEADVKYESVDAGRVLAQMEDAENGLNIIILDACRNNPFGRSFRSAERGLAKMDAPRGSILAYATAPGSVAADGNGRNGLYTSYLLKHMMTPDLKLEDMFKRVRISVSKASAKKQIPWESSSLMADFQFASKRSIAVVSQPKPNEAATGPGNVKNLQSSVDKDMVFWQTIQGSDNPVLYQAYLDKFPDGTFNTLAKIKISELEKKMEPDASDEAPTASIHPSASDPDAIEQDGSFIKYPTGIVFDEKIGLEWYAGPDKNMNWYQVKRWVEALAVAGGGWRMPTIEELKTLYQKGAGSRNMTPLLKTTAWYVWSSASTSRPFNFLTGAKKWKARVNSDYGRGFAVRSR